MSERVATRTLKRESELAKAKAEIAEKDKRIAEQNARIDYVSDEFAKLARKFRALEVYTEMKDMRLVKAGAEITRLTSELEAAKAQIVPKNIAERLVDWLSDQRYQGEPLLHAIVCCDLASRRHFVDAVAKQIDRERGERAISIEGETGDKP